MYRLEPVMKYPSRPNGCTQRTFISKHPYETRQMMYLHQARRTLALLADVECGRPSVPTRRVLQIFLLTSLWIHEGHHRVGRTQVNSNQQWRLLGARLLLHQCLPSHNKFAVMRRGLGLHMRKRFSNWGGLGGKGIPLSIGWPLRRGCTPRPLASKG